MGDRRNIDSETLKKLMKVEADTEHKYAHFRALRNRWREWLGNLMLDPAASHEKHGYYYEENAAYAETNMERALRDAAEEKRAILREAGYPEDWAE